MAYRVKHDVEDDEEREMPYEVEAEDGPSVPVTAKSWFRRYLRAVFADREDARDAFRALVKAGCQRHFLSYWLHVLASPAPPKSRADLERAAKQLAKAGSTVFEIALSAHAKELDPEGRFDGLERVLWKYSQRLGQVAARASRRKPLAQDSALATVFAHVKVRTRRYHDDHVATLVEAVRQFAVRASSRNASTVSMSAHEAVAYSTENRARWRSRHHALVRTAVMAENRRQTAVRKAPETPVRLSGLRPRQRYLPTALAAARQLYPNLDWRPLPRPKSVR
jgi:hypothetical protein